MAGKYHHLRNVLERRPIETLEYGQKITLVRSKYAHLSKGELADAIAECKNSIEDLKQRKSELELLLAAHDKLLVEHLEGEGEESFKRTGGGSFFIQDKLYPSVFDKESFRLWSLKNGYERQMTLHHSTVEGIVSERLQRNMPLPDGVKAYIDVRIGVRGVLKK